jgi:hypothetical protein
MSVRSFHSVFMATAVAGAALGCYLVSLRVASERAALEEVESAIVETQGQIRLLQTEVGTRSRLGQLERWNVSALALSAPTAGQILGDTFQLARLVQPQHRFDPQAPVVLASAPAPQPQLAGDGDADVAPVAQLLHEASFEVPPTRAPEAKAVPLHEAVEAKVEKPKPTPKSAPVKTATSDKKAGDKSLVTPPKSVTKPVRTAKVDPLAPLPAGASTAKALRSDR